MVTTSGTIRIRLIAKNIAQENSTSLLNFKIIKLDNI